MTRWEMRVVASWLAWRGERVVARRAARSAQARRQPRDASGRWVSRQRRIEWGAA